MAVIGKPRATAMRGSIYLGGAGFLPYVLHRISGIAVVYFLALHIFEALQLFGGAGGLQRSDRRLQTIVVPAL